jgi:hypothetical protein
MQEKWRSSPTNQQLLLSTFYVYHITACMYVSYLNPPAWRPQYGFFSFAPNFGDQNIYIGKKTLDYNYTIG